MSFFNLFHHRKFLAKIDHAAVIAALKQAEATTAGQIRVCISRKTARDPVAVATKHFAKLNAHKTPRPAIFFFVASRSRTFAVLGNALIHDKSGAEGWKDLSEGLEKQFRAGEFTAGLVEAIGKAGALLAKHFPPEPNAPTPAPAAETPPAAPEPTPSIPAPTAEAAPPEPAPPTPSTPEPIAEAKPAEPAPAAPTPTPEPAPPAPAAVSEPEPAPAPVPTSPDPEPAASTPAPDPTPSPETPVPESEPPTSPTPEPLPEPAPESTPPEPDAPPA